MVQNWWEHEKLFTEYYKCKFDENVEKLNNHWWEFDYKFPCETNMKMFLKDNYPQGELILIVLIVFDESGVSKSKNGKS